MNKVVILFIVIFAAACSSGSVKKESRVNETPAVVNTNSAGSGPVIAIELVKGESFYYPLMAAWIEDMDGKYIQTLYVAESVAKGVFKYGKQEGGKWISAPKRAPQTLPYWAHKRGVRASDGLYMPEPANPVADAYTGATPAGSFVIYARTDEMPAGNFRVLFEINQNWDWNEYWTNDKYPGDENYKMSCQPALVYEAVIDINSTRDPVTMKAIGHSHYSGKTGELFTDLSTFTTALQIAGSLIVSVK